MENCPPTPELTLTQTLTPNMGQFSSGGNCLFAPPPNPKTNPSLDQNPNPNGGGGNFPRGAIVRTLLKKDSNSDAFL